MVAPAALAPSTQRSPPISSPDSSRDPMATQALHCPSRGAHTRLCSYTSLHTRVPPAHTSALSCRRTVTSCHWGELLHAVSQAMGQKLPPTSPQAPCRVLPCPGTRKALSKAQQPTPGQTTSHTWDAIPDPSRAWHPPQPQQSPHAEPLGKGRTGKDAFLRCSG